MPIALSFRQFGSSIYRPEAFDDSLREPDQLASDPSGTLHAATYETQGVLRLWSSLDRGKIADREFPGDVRGLSFSPDGKWLAVAASDETHLFSLTRPEILCSCGYHSFPIHAFDLMEKDQHLITLSRIDLGEQTRTRVTCWKDHDPVHHLWDSPIQKQEIAPTLLAASPASSGVIWAVSPRLIQLRDTTIATPPTAMVTVTTKDQVEGPFAFSQQGTSFWSVEENSIISRDAHSGAIIGRKIDFPNAFSGRVGFYSLAEGNGVLAAGGRDGQVYLFRVADGNRVKRFDCFEDSSYRRFSDVSIAVRSVIYSPSDGCFLAGTDEGKIWRLNPEKDRGTVFQAHTDRIETMAIDPSGKYLASGGRDRTIKLWEWTGSDYELRVDLTHTGSKPVRQLKFSHDGEKLYALYEKETAVRVWDLKELRKQFARYDLNW